MLTRLHMFVIYVKLREKAMQITLAPVNAELSNRVVVLLSDEMLKALDEWRWENRVSSRGEAIRLMVAEKLEQKPPRPKGKPK
jgi:Ribbon-helix-helix protein, copG family